MVAQNWARLRYLEQRRLQTEHPRDKMWHDITSVCINMSFKIAKVERVAVWFKASGKYKLIHCKLACLIICILLHRLSRFLLVNNSGRVFIFTCLNVNAVYCSCETRWGNIASDVDGATDDDKECLFPYSTACCMRKLKECSSCHGKLTFRTAFPSVILASNAFQDGRMAFLTHNLAW